MQYYLAIFLDLFSLCLDTLYYDETNIFMPFMSPLMNCPMEDFSIENSYQTSSQLDKQGAIKLSRRN